jgi:hypothetical protein
MDDESERFTFDQHLNVGHKLKVYTNSIEQIRAELARRYPKSAKKEIKQLETASHNAKLVQTSLHSRLLAEFPEKSDDELLPVYLGRLPSQDK